jgi:hypothetical protein
MRRRIGKNLRTLSKTVIHGEGVISMREMK